jgi:Mrp family chromosome partitioning ATPase
LLETRNSLTQRLADIDSRRTELEIQAEIEGSGLAFYSPATATPVASGAGLLFTTVGGLFLGGILALGVAYALGSWRRRFSDWGEPEVVLGAPFLAEIPRWDVEETSTLLPVRDDPRSLLAEAFRFASASLDIRLSRDHLKLVNFVSGSVGEGKSTLVANTALAAARAGKRVLLIDADFGNQDSSRLLFGDLLVGPGLTELVAGLARIQSAVAAVPLSEGNRLDVIGRGMQAVTAPDFFASTNIAPILAEFAGSYDMVLIDGPPLLQVAYASTIARFADAVVIVVSHGSPIRAAEELGRRIGFIGTHVVGYIYNQAPRRSGRDVSGGSMKDVLGDQGLVAPASTSRAGRRR